VLATFLWCLILIFQEQFTVLKDFYHFNNNPNGSGKEKQIRMWLICVIVCMYVVYVTTQLYHVCGIICYMCTSLIDEHVLVFICSAHITLQEAQDSHGVKLDSGMSMWNYMLHVHISLIAIVIVFTVWHSKRVYKHR